MDMDIFLRMFFLLLLSFSSFSYASSDEVDPKAYKQLMSQCHDKSKSARRALDLELSDAVKRVCQFTLPSISATGDQVYIFYENPVGFNAAELFNNVNGKLKTARTLPVDPKFPVLLSGYASPDFTRFSILDQPNSDTPHIKSRIRILDQNFKVVAKRLFSTPVQTVFPFSSLFSGGAFSDDSKHVVVTYINNPLAANAISTLLVLRASDLTTVAENNSVSGFDGAPLLFNLTKKCRKSLYISFTSSQGQDTEQPLESIDNTNLPPYFDQVYKVDLHAGTITLVDELPLPKFAEKDVLSRGSDALIAHGGFESSFPNSISIYKPLPSQLLTQLPGDNSEARVSLFDGKKLKVVIKQALDNCNATTIYPPGLGCSYCLGQNTYFTVFPGSDDDLSFQSEFYSLVAIEKNSSGKLVFRPQNLPNQEGAHNATVFSADGKWFLRTGPYGFNVPPKYKPHPDLLGISNIILKRVTSDSYTPTCKIRKKNSED